MRTIRIAALAAVLCMGTQAAWAQKVIRAASCFPQGHSLSADFEAMVKEVNAKAQGWSIRYLGGAPAIGSPFTLVQNMSKGVYDMTFCPNSYYQNVLVEADALKLLEKSMEEIRRNGGFEYIDKLHQEKNVKLLGRLNNGLRMHVYLRADKPINGPSLNGLQLRAAPIYAPFFQALGANTLQTDLTQVFTLLDNKTVDGYGWTAIGMLPDWYRVTGYRVDPGFYDAGIEILMHLQAWKELTDAQKKTLNDFVLAHEQLTVKKTQADTEAHRRMQTEKGVKPLVLTGADRDKWLGTAREVGWASVKKASPQHGTALQKLFAD